MIPFLIYVLAGLAVGAHILYLLSWAYWGAPTHALQYVALGGSAGLVVAAYVALFRARTAGRIAAVSTIAVWCFYGPATTHTIETLLTTWHPGMGRIAAAVLFVFSSLILATGYAVVSTLKLHSDQSGWAFPQNAQRATRLAVGLLTAVTIIISASWAWIQHERSQRRPHRYLIPDGYVGWVRIEYDVKDQPALPVEDGSYVVRFPHSGTL